MESTDTAETFRAESFESAAPARRGPRLHVLGGGDAPLPQAVEAEASYLACCMLDGAMLVPRGLKARLKREHFYLQAHGLLWEKIVGLHRGAQPTTIDCVAEALRASGELEQLGGTGYDFLVEVSRTSPTHAEGTFFLERVIATAVLRGYIRDCSAGIEEARKFSAHAELATFLAARAARVQRQAEFAAGLARKDSMQDLAAAATARGLAAIAGKKDRSRELVTGLPHLDAKILPFDVNNEDWMIVLAAAPSVGKSSLAAQIADANLERGKRIAVFLLETGATGWLLRLAARRAGVDVRNLDREMPDRITLFKRYQQQIEGWIAQGRLHVYDDIFGVEAILLKIREVDRTLREQEVARGVPADEVRGLDGAVVDYLQLIAPANSKAPREQQVADISRRLKLGLKGVNITGFILAQLNRKARDEERRPRQSDLRESGAIEQDADRIELLHVPKENRDGNLQDENSGTLLVELLQVKSRNGPQGIVDLLFHRRATRFEDAPFKGQARPGAPKPADGYKRNGGAS